MKNHTCDHLNNAAADMRYRLAASYLSVYNIRSIIEIGGYNPAAPYTPKILPYLVAGHHQTITIIDPRGPDYRAVLGTVNEHQLIMHSSSFQEIIATQDRFENDQKSGIGLCILGCSLGMQSSGDITMIVMLADKCERVVLEYRLTNPLGVQQVANLTESLEDAGEHERIAELQFNMVHGKGYVKNEEVFHDPRRFIVYQRKT